VLVFSAVLKDLLQSLAFIKFSTLHILLAFVSSFVLWFLTIYFFKYDLLVNHGLIITLLVVFSLTIAWCLINFISLSHGYFVGQKRENPKSEIDLSDEGYKSAKNISIFSEIIFLHGGLIWLRLLVDFSLFTLVTSLFVLVFLQSLLFGYQSYKLQLEKKQNYGNINRATTQEI